MTILLVYIMITTGLLFFHQYLVVKVILRLLETRSDYWQLGLLKLWGAYYVLSTVGGFILLNRLCMAEQ